MDKKGTTVPNRPSRLQHQSKIGTQPAAGAAAAGAGGVGVEPPQQTPKRLSFAPLAAPVLIDKTRQENIKEAKEDSPAKAEEAKDQKERPWLLVSALNGTPAVIAQPNPQPGFRPAGFRPGFVRVSCRFHTRPSGSTPDLRVLYGIGVRGFSVSLA